MIGFLLSILADGATSFGARMGFLMIPAVEALEQPPINHSAHRYRTAAFCFFSITGLLAFPAAIVHSIKGECDASNVLGFGAIAALSLCLLCGVRYGQLNRPSETTE